MKIKKGKTEPKMLSYNCTIDVDNNGLNDLVPEVLSYNGLIDADRIGL